VQEIDDPHLLAWCRYDQVTANRVLVIVNMRPGETRSGPLRLDPAALGLEGRETLLAHDLLDDAVHAWHLDAVTVECTPERPVRVYRLVTPLGTEPLPA
jgi:hypothetical protein